ncbi:MULTISPECIES: hypothetical protein [unclassified Streptomyces]|uniref:hypothetical protein n=1 Tax=unclassified Streptomyces TaxID=2593676 RepID=UPI0022570587|nr:MULTISPECIES: hypothetical protein [unclassified Streptomyces]MCX4834676.1 hypothetical protein [Streptomyces sp. NBC_01016]
MERTRGHQEGVTVLRAWVERGDPTTGLRVRIIRVADSERSLTTVETTVDAVCAAVRVWLLELLADEAADTTGGTPAEPE